MSNPFVMLRKYGLDAIFIGLPAGGALACWFYALPRWMLVICLIWLAIATVSLLGDLGFFGPHSDD